MSLERLVSRAALIVVPLMVVAALAIRVASGSTYVYLYNFGAAALAFGPLGSLILIRRPGHTIGRLFLVLAAAGAVQILFGSLAVAVGSGGLAVASAVLRFGALSVYGLLLLLFPTGSPPLPRWRAAGWVLVAGSLLMVAGVAIAPGPIEDVPTLTNPIGFSSAGEPLVGMGFGIVALGIVAAVVSVVVRYRRARGDERQQLKLFALVAASTFGGIVAATVAFPYQVENTVLGDVVWTSPMVLLPAAVAAAILRHGLYDIDRIISRTLSYGILSGCLLGAYALSVFVLGSVLRPVIGSGDIVVAASILVVAGVFGPVRRRVQSFIDRRFNRARYDAARTIEAFSAHLREEVDLASLTAELTDVVKQTMAPASVSIWLREKRP